MPNIGLPELLVILFIVILLFGTSKLPQLGKGIGEGIKNFKDSMKEGQSGDAKSTGGAEDKEAKK